MSTRRFAQFRFSKLLTAALGSLGLKIGAAGMGLINGVLLARMLGPSEFGVYSIAMAAVTFLGTLAALGLPTFVTREVAVHHARGNWSLLKGVLQNSQRLIMLGAALVVGTFAVLVLVEVVPTPLTTRGLLSVLALVPLFALNQLRAAILRGLHWILSADVPDLVIRPFSMLLLLGGMYGASVHIDADGALFLQAAAAVLAAAVASWLVAQRLPKSVRLAETQSVHSRRFHISGVFFALTALGLLEGQVPLYLLGHLAGATEAGLYQAASQIVGLVVMGLVAINMPLQPRLAAAWVQVDRTGAQKLVTEATRLATAMALISSLILMLFAEWILRIYGVHYVEAAGALRFLVLGQFINAISGPCGFVLVAAGKQVLALYGVATGLLVSTTVTWMLVPAYGLVGAAIGGMSGLLAWNVLLSYWAWRFVGIRTWVH